ncbi:hypothetical protein EBZ38_03455 [bacterium]|nr:hypothetical protein [bacterium]NDC94019.1 hypothetical protein [bacterium]NDD83324.1 hypothetical protein [bacterium]
MGACDISFTIGKKASESEVKSYFEKQKIIDREENGTQSGYSGDFQTVDRVECHFQRIFTSRSEAMEYCLEKASKWDYVVAVHYHDVAPPITKTELKIKERIVKLNQDLEQMRLIKKTTGFTKCSACGSRLANARLRRKWCPLCDNSLLTEREESVFKKKKELVETLNKKLLTLREHARQKLIQKQGLKNVKTLVAGLGAC